MQIVYLGRASRRVDAPPSIEGDAIELLSNNWDDFGYKTSFPTVCRINGKEVDLGLIRLLIEGVQTSSTRLNRLLKEGWDGTFPIPDLNYVSTPSEITFYEQLDGLIGTDGAIDVAKALKDASYLVRIAEDRAANQLVGTTGFNVSLQRERGSVKAFLDAWKIFSRESIAVLNLGFRFVDVYDEISTLNLKFQSDNSLPHDINVLIGPNGAGKSRVLHQIVASWLDPEESEESEAGFLNKPNLSQIVVVSYSPFENFPVDIEDRALQDIEAYRYFGFRGRSIPAKGRRLGHIRLSRAFPQRNAAQALIACLVDDKRYSAIRDWAQKVQTIEKVLKTAFSFDFAAVEVELRGQPERFYNNSDLIDPLAIDLTVDDEVKRYIPISSDRISEIKESEVLAKVSTSEGVIFFKDGQRIYLSSGQRLFSYIVINILGAIRKNSLILIDEPELFLHPTLEIQFIEMLKTILSRFNSKALMATHSVVTVREMPGDCVHVFERTEDGLVLKNPPFQTFGGDVQRISSYVFGDSAVSKPFEKWIEAQLEEGSADELISKIGEELNEEMIIQIKARG